MHCTQERTQTAAQPAGQQLREPGVGSEPGISLVQQVAMGGPTGHSSNPQKPEAVGLGGCQRDRQNILLCWTVTFRESPLPTRTASHGSELGLRWGELRSVENVRQTLH